jgi:hypothetical protein
VKQSSGSTKYGRRQTDPIIGPLVSSAPWAFATLLVLNAADILASIQWGCG